MANILFVHNGAPGRFAFLAKALLARGDRCALINPPEGTDLAGIVTHQWRSERGSTPDLFPPATKAEADLLRAHAAAKAAQQVRDEGFTPDIIVGHSGWGEMALLREVFPNARQIQLAEYYYRPRGSDVDFDPELANLTFENAVMVSTKNAVLAMSLADADRIVAPTPFQAGMLPPAFAARARVIHEGVDTAAACARPDVRLQLPSGVILDRSSPVVTFINRNFEPLRGFHTFMRALPDLLAGAPDAHVLIIGADSPQIYGSQPPSGGSWKQAMLSELDGQIDFGRVHFVGQLAYEQLIATLSISAAHVYLTYPFVLSWSLLDAMACECLLVASDTAPVRDLITHGETGLLVDFFDHKALAATLVEACRNPDAYTLLRHAARAKAVAEYDRATVCRPAWLALIDEVLAG
ncbi:MAG: glycosyltransferase [Caulobacteraceae bacterium]